jgi:ABC-type multidrug transport system fused ATPase/permease subunit
MLNNHNPSTMTIKEIISKYKLRFTLTFGLILLEAGIMLLFPLFIGNAVDGAIGQEFSGAIWLGVLGVSMLVVGIGRRMFDSRLYGKVYEETGAKILNGIENGLSSIKTARLSMIRELIEFLENALPELINSLIGLIGVVIILATLNLNVFLGSIVVTLLIFVIYWLTSKKTMELNQQANDVHEQQVDIIAGNNSTKLTDHLRQVSKWNIRLSDLEAINFSFSWMIALAFLVGAIIISAGTGVVKYGALFALVMYVFQFIESIISLPLFYQNWLRLKEILLRLK